MLGGRYCTPIVERPEAPLLISYQLDRQESSGVKIGRRFTIVVFLASPDSKRINGKCTTQRGELVLYLSFIARGSLPSRFFMPPCARPEPKRKWFEALMALESDLERPKKRRWKPWPRVPSSSICQRAVEDSARCDGAGDRGASLIGQAGEARTYRLESLPSSQSRRTS
jgi:hypothetical protein